MISIHLYRPYWINKKVSEMDIHVCGWAEYEQTMYKSDSLLELVSKKMNHAEIQTIQEFLLLLNGNFSVIIKSDEKALLCVDKMRCYPVIYFNFQETFYITDDIAVFQQNHTDSKLHVNNDTVEQYLCSNYVIGPYTIYDNVFSVQSGEFIEIKDRKFTRHQYFQWKPNMENDAQRDLFKESQLLDAVFTKVIERIITSAPDVHNWVVPLSGGHDSRLIINYFHKLGIKNVLCFSYGMKNNNEAKISEIVAKKLGYKWYFIEQSPENIFEVQQSKAMDDYRKYAFNGTSVPHLQDFVAVYMLKKMGVIQTGDIFVPGHAHEVLTGSHLEHKVNCCSSIYESLIFIKRHFSGFGYAKRSVNLINNVLSIIDKYNINANQISEYFDWQERQTKYIANSVRVYEYLGFEWRIPQWDYDLFNYWKNIGFNYRYGRVLYFSIEKISLLSDLLKDISFTSDLKERIPLKTQIITSVPLFLKKIIRFFGYNKSGYYVSTGSHLLYTNKLETIKDYQKSYAIPAVIMEYLSHYPQKMKFQYFQTDNVSTLLIIRDVISSCN